MQIFSITSFLHMSIINKIITNMNVISICILYISAICTFIIICYLHMNLINE